MAAPEGLILPLEMLQEIFSYLEVQEIEKSVAPVCRLWRDASRLPVVRRRLRLSDGIDRSAAHEMLRSSPLLTELTILYCSPASYTNDLLRTAASHNLKLRVLEVCSSVSDIGLEAVALCTELRTLLLRSFDYRSCRVTDSGVVDLARLSHLENLERDAANRVTPDEWRRLFSICEWPHLLELSLNLCDDAREVPRLHFERLHTTLRSIKLRGRVSDMDLEAVAQCDQLRTLSLHDITRVTDRGLLHLARLRHVDKLELRGASRVTAAGWRRLLSECEWPHLRELSLRLCYDESREPRLHFERLHTTLRSIELSGFVSDVDLEAVAQCDELRTLTLDTNYGVTDVGIVHLARLSNLEKLTLRSKVYFGCRVTAAGWRRLFSTCEWPHLRQLTLPFDALDEGDRDDLCRQAKLLGANLTWI